MTQDWQSELRLFPLALGEKTPAHKGWQSEATTDAEKIAAWRNAGHDLAIACGRESNLLVLDIDSEAAEAQLKRIEREANAHFHGTHTVHTSKSATGFQKYHWYFKYPTHGTTLKNGVRLCGDGIDIRTTGGLVVAAGARSIPNHEYTVQNDREPAELSKQIVWVLEKLQAEKKSASASAPTEKIKEGTRNDTLFNLGCSLRSKGLSFKAIEAALLEHNAEHCETPLRNDEIRNIAESAAKPSPSAARTESKPKRKLFTVGPKSLAEVESEKTNWLWPNVIVAGELNLFIGDPDVGKSLVTIAALACLTTGGPFPFSSKIFEPSSAAVWCNEDSFAGKWKPRAIAAGVDISRFVPRVGVGSDPEDSESYPLCLDQQEHLEALRTFIVEHPEVKLVVIDPLSDFVGNCDIYKPTVREITRPLKRIAEETGVAILLIHHTNKRIAETAIKAAAGSQQIMAAVSNAFLFAKHDDQFLMLQVRNKSGTRRNYKYRIVGKPWPDGFEPADAEEAEDGIGVVEFVGKTNVTADEILSQKLEKDESTVSKVRRQVKELLKNGPKSSDECLRTLRAFGYDTNTINKASDQLGVKRDKKTWTPPPETSASPKAEETQINLEEQPK
jgi:hypothetical protein